MSFRSDKTTNPNFLQISTRIRQLCLASSLALLVGNSSFGVLAKVASDASDTQTSHEQKRKPNRRYLNAYPTRIMLDLDPRMPDDDARHSFGYHFDADEPKESRLPISINFRAQSGLSVNFIGDSNNDMPGAYLLASIDGEPLKGKQGSSLREFSVGPSGKKVTLGLIDNNGHFHQTTTEYKAQSKTRRDNLAIASLRNQLHKFEGGDDPVPQLNSNFLANSYYGHRIDPFATAECLGDLESAKDFPANSKSLIKTAAASVAIGLLDLGAIAPANNTLKNIDELSQTELPNSQSSLGTYSKLLTLLDFYGRYDEALKIARSMANIKQFQTNKNSAFSRSIFDGEYLKVLEGYLRNLADSGSRIDSSVLSLPDKNSSTLNPMTPAWQGDNFARFKDYQSAAVCYEEELKRSFPSNAAASDKTTVQLENSRFECQLRRHLAELYSKQINYPKAIEQLLKADKIYTDNYTNEELAQLESVPLFSPSASLIEFELADAYLKSGDSKSAIKYARQASGRLSKLYPNDKNASDDATLKEFSSNTWKQKFADAEKNENSATEKPTESDKTFIALLCDQYRAITSGVLKDKSNRDIDQLFDLYLQSKNRLVSNDPFIDMQACLTNLVRAEADAGYFAQSNALLDKLMETETSSAPGSVDIEFLKIEKALNSDLEGKDNPELWTQCIDQWTSGLSRAEKLRALAALYLDAGQLKRTNILIKRGLEETKKQMHLDVATAFSTALLNLDKTYLMIQQNDLNGAKKCLQLSLSTVDSLPIQSMSHELDVFNRFFLTRTIKIARYCRLNNQHSVALEIMEKVNQRIDDKKCWLGVYTPTESSNMDIRLRNFYGYYGRLLLEDKKLSKASFYLDIALRDFEKNQPADLSILRSQCASQKGDFAKTATDLLDLLSSSQLNDTLFAMEPEEKAKYSRLALEDALKVKDFNQNKLSALYIERAQCLEQAGTNTESVELLKNALKASTPESPEHVKAEQLLGMHRANMKQSEADIIDALAIKEQAAITAEREKKSDAPRLWAELGSDELNNKQYDSAIKHFNHALDIKEIKEIKGTKATKPPSTDHLVDFPIFPFLNAGRFSDLEHLYLRLLEYRRDQYGSTSPAYTNLLRRLYILYAMQNDSSKAIEFLDKFLAIDPRKQELGVFAESTQDTIFFPNEYLLTECSNQTLLMKIFDHILKSQVEIYGRDDAHVADTLTQMGTLEIKLNNLEQAEKYLTEAIAIKRHYSLTLNQPRFTAYSLDDANTLGAIRKLHKAQGKKDVQRDNAEQKMQMDEEQKHQGIAWNASREKVAELYEWWHSRAPYNYDCVQDGDKLIELDEQNKNWYSILKVAPEVIKALSHNSLYAVGGCTPSPQPAAQKFRAFRAVIEACIKTNRPDEANRWLDRAIAEESYAPGTAELFFLGEISNACGRKEKALIYCRRAEQSIEANIWCVWADEIEQLYEKLGAEQDLKRISERIKRDLRKSALENQQKFEEKHKLEQSKQSRLKQPPLRNSSDSFVETNMAHSDHDDRPQSLTFSQVETIKDKYLFNYAAFAIEHLWLQDGAKILASTEPAPNPQYSFAGSHIGMATCQPPHNAGDFIFIYDGPANSLQLKPAKSEFKKEASTQFYAPPPIMALPLMHSLEPPNNAKILSSDSVPKALTAGNYIVQHISTGGIELPETGIVRLFVQDAPGEGAPFYIAHSKSYMFDSGAPDGTKPVFELKAHTQFNCQKQSHSNSIEIWYEGSGEIWLDDDVSFQGIIYAPNAIIRLHNRVNFTGAMVAANIVAGSDCKIMYDTSLKNWKPVSF